MKQKITRVLLFSLIVSVFMVCTVSAMWSATGSGLKTTQISPVTSAIQPSIANSPQTCSIVGVWTNYDVTSPDYPWSTTFNSDGTWSDTAGEYGTWIVVDAKNHIYQFDYGGIWTFTLSSDCSSFTATNTDQGRTVLGTRISTMPIAGFSALPVKGTVPLTVQFTDRSTGDITSWNWDFGDSYTSSETSPSHEYTKTGLYTVKLEVNKGQLNSDIATKTKYINVTPDQSEIAIVSAKWVGGKIPPFFLTHTRIIWTDKDGNKKYIEGGPADPQRNDVYPTCGSSTCEDVVWAQTEYSDWTQDNTYTKPQTLLKGIEARDKEKCITQTASLINQMCTCYVQEGPNSNSIIYTEIAECNIPTKGYKLYNSAAGWGMYLLM
jgi:PKD repeat protein